MTTSSPDPTPTQQSLHDALMAGLATQANSLADAATALKTVTADATAQTIAAYRFSRQLKVILAVGGVLIAVLLYNSFQNRATLSGVKRSNSLILSCTDPDGKCAKAGAANQASAVAQIVSAINAHTDLVFMSTIVCERQTTTAAQFTTCMRNKGVTATTGGN